MGISQKNKIGLSAGTAVALALLIAYQLLSFSNKRPPSIEGVFFPSARPLKDFSLLDHHNRAFDNTHLLGQWHLLSYGYTHCPDICPTTLATLSKAVKEIEGQAEYSDLGLLFYSVDPMRDTSEHLGKYLSWFHKGFIGLLPAETESNAHLPFEQSLGIISLINPRTQPTSEYAYEVSHGLMIYLINPQGQLQAVLKPQKQKDGSLYFLQEQIAKDYQAIRRYLKLS